MKGRIIKNLRRRYKNGKGSNQTTLPFQTELPVTLDPKKSVNIIVNINKFDKPVGAVVIPGAGNNINDIKDVIEIKKEE